MVASPIPRRYTGHSATYESRARVDSSSFVRHRRAGLILTIRNLKAHSIPVFEEPLRDLPPLSSGMIRFALRGFPNLLGRADD